MELGGVHGGQGPESIHPKETPAERKKRFEMQWEMSIIGIYVAVSRKGGDATHPLDTLKKDLDSDKPPEQLVPALNQVIDLINKDLPSDAAPLPPFDLTSGGNEQKAMAQYAITLEKFLNAAAQQGQIPWKEQEVLFNQTRDLVDHIGAVPLDEAVNRLNAIIEEANQSLPLSFQLDALY
ncbi:MAG: hypothetical protein S4CHLAM2_00710 [Chlamydiales bacterium]|nr:hypothetical protein [Chlamydiales bacterium]